ncbi:MAG: SsrA-binding protein SmpB [Alphaproteobacteria bacterium]
MNTKTFISKGIVARNRKARFNYAINEKLEAGIMLTGSEVKSLRMGLVNIEDAYASQEEGELYLINCHIGEYSHSDGYSLHETNRKRKLLLRSKQLNTFVEAVSRKGATIVPLAIYFNDRGIAKVELGLGVGKKLYDKRETVKNRDWDRQKARIMREKG